MILLINISKEAYDRLQNNNLLMSDIYYITGLVANGIVYEEIPNDKWIPVSERLPKKYEEVVVTDIVTSDVYIARYVGNMGWECDDGFYKNRIVAWQPLPEPYKKEVEK